LIEFQSFRKEVFTNYGSNARVSELAVEGVSMRRALPHSGLEFAMLAVQEPGRTIVPTLRYRDVAAAVDWLCTAFGFERHLVVPGANGAVRYAELTFGDGMIILGPVQDSAFEGPMTQPVDARGLETQICYLFVEDAGDHCTIARAAGAEIVLDIKEDDGGGRGYSCRDPEGHTWNVGTYNPWQRQSQSAGLVDAPDRGSNWGRGLRRVAVMGGLLVTMAASAVAFEWALGAVDWTSFGSQPAAATSMGADAPAKVEGIQLARACEEREVDERAIRNLQMQLALERSAKEAAERGEHAEREQAKEAREQLTRELTEAAQRIALEKHKQAEQAAEQLAAERSRRAAAQAQQAQEQEAERAKQASREKKVARERAATEAQKRQRRLVSHSQATVVGPAFPLW
jgi:uncharacterized glyoxalase superfamily protein PhnB